MGSSVEHASTDDNVKAASPPVAASNGTRSSGSRRKEAHSRSKEADSRSKEAGRRSKRSTADPKSAKSSKKRGESSSREKGKSGPSHSAKPKNPVADYLRQRLMGGVESKSDEPQEPPPQPALRSRLVRLPTKSAPHSRFALCIA